MPQMWGAWVTEEPIDRLAKAARELLNAISFDNNGALIGGQWMGGNGGLYGVETLAKADALRRALPLLTPKPQEPKP